MLRPKEAAAEIEERLQNIRIMERSMLYNGASVQLIDLIGKLRKEIKEIEQQYPSGS